MPPPFQGSAAARIAPRLWTLAGKTVCCIQCRPSPEPVFVGFRGEEVFYVRSRPSTEALGPSEMHAYVAERLPG